MVSLLVDLTKEAEVLLVTQHDYFMNDFFRRVSRLKAIIEEKRILNQTLLNYFDGKDISECLSLH